MEGGKGGKEGTGISFDVLKLFRSEKVSLMKYSRFANTCHLTLARELLANADNSIIRDPPPPRKYLPVSVDKYLAFTCFSHQVPGVFLFLLRLGIVVIFPHPLVFHHRLGDFHRNSFDLLFAWAATVFSLLVFVAIALSLLFQKKTAVEYVKADVVVIKFIFLKAPD